MWSCLLQNLQWFFCFPWFKEMILMTFLILFCLTSLHDPSLYFVITCSFYLASVTVTPLSPSQMPYLRKVQCRKYCCLVVHGIEGKYQGAKHPCHMTHDDLFVERQVTWLPWSPASAKVENFRKYKETNKRWDLHQSGRVV